MEVGRTSSPIPDSSSLQDVTSMSQGSSELGSGDHIYSFSPVPSSECFSMQNTDEELGSFCTDHEPACTQNHDSHGVPVMLEWNYGGTNIQVQGSWDNWSSRKDMIIDGDHHTILLVLPPGRYEYKIILDKNWMYPDEVLEKAHNELIVQGDISQELKAPVSRPRPLDSPISTYCDTFISTDEVDEELPELPPALVSTVLNAAHDEDETTVLPHHVTLNHVYEDGPVNRKYSGTRPGAFGLTHRFRSKYVSLVLYKPEKPSKAG